MTQQPPLGAMSRDELLAYALQLHEANAKATELLDVYGGHHGVCRRASRILHEAQRHGWGGHALCGPELLKALGNA